MKHTTVAAQKNVIGARVKKARLAAKPAITQDDLAGRLANLGIAVDRSAISRIESQTRFVMDYEVKALARALKITIGQLYGEG
jgi:ribosome-binding protein aMBF1 (putative translation factor)